MFWNRNKIKLESMKILNPTSKMALKMQCLCTCDGDVDKAEKLYDFMIKDAEDLPTSDPIKPNMMKQITGTAGDVFGWVKENKDDVFSLIDFIKGLKSGGSITPPPSTPLPPIN